MIRPRRGLLREWGILALLLVCLLIVCQRYAVFERGDGWAYDLAVRFDVRLAEWSRAAGGGAAQSVAGNAAGNAASNTPPDDPLIVAIDEASLAAFGRWPWSRRLLADALERLADAGSGPVLLDIILAEAQADDPSADAALAAAMARHRREAGGVVLPAFVPDERPGQAVGFLLPQQRFAAVARVGHAHALIDGDGVARRMWPREAPTGGNPAPDGTGATLPHVAWVLLDRTSDAVPPAPTLAAAAASTAASAAGPVLVPFAGPSGYFPRIAFIDLLRGQVPPERLRGRTILIGATASGLGDTVITPLTERGGLMPGVEFVANVVHALRAGPLPRPLGNDASLLLSAALLLALLSVFLLAPPRRALIATVLACALAVLGAWLGLRLAGRWWPPADFVVAAALAYPLWSWRRLEASLRAMERETRRIAGLARVAAAPAQSAAVSDAVAGVVVGAASAAASATASARFATNAVADPLAIPAPRPGAFLDPVESRIEAIGAAVDRIAAALVVVGDPREERRLRDEMLRHLAHDLRSPLISLRGLADELRGAMPAAGPTATQIERIERIDHFARNALDLSEQFLLLGRAENLTPADLRPVDLVDTLHAAADDLWEDARRQGARIERRCTVDEALVAGDARLLRRVLLNLGWNALRHGPAQGVVTLSLGAEPDGRWRLGVHDQGRGFPAEALERLTAAWRQADDGDSHKDKGQGYGLGLNFVGRVAERHGAALFADPSPHGDGFTLWLVFPPSPPVQATLPAPG